MQHSILAKGSSKQERGKSVLQSSNGVRGMSRTRLKGLMEVLDVLDSSRKCLQEAAQLLHVLRLPVSEVREVQERRQGLDAEFICEV